MDSERYPEISHGLFPLFLLATAGFAVVEFAPAELYQVLAPHYLSPQNAAAYDDIVLAAQVILFPFLFFVFFLLVSRVRVVLERDYARIALSIFLGALAAAFFINLVNGIWYSDEVNYYRPAGFLVYTLGLSISNSLEYVFVGFAAVFVSYLRRL